MARVTQSITLTVAQRKKLAARRHAKEMTVSDLAAAVGVDRSMIAHIENGTKAAPISLLSRVAKRLDLAFSARLDVKLD
ncbi:MAG: helix-turn-helix transcriptional regulator [Pirellulales bacterium]|nr:helix-turn-helix transcriptional regulator [Pirellulales bacterium]